jgi:hypothetical protein
MARTELAHLHYGDEGAIGAVGRPLGRVAEIGDACVFVASDRASCIRRACLLVHGGGERPAFLDAAGANK